MCWPLRSYDNIIVAPFSSYDVSSTGLLLQPENILVLNWNETITLFIIGLLIIPL